jgi:tripartite-type tricarboxylate transporter receptor subunit TctC
MMARCSKILWIACAALASLLAVNASADTYPSRPIKLIVPWVAGGSAEVLARVVTAKMSASLGQPFVIETRSGANGTIGTAAVAKAPPDGYTLLLSHMGPTAISPAVQKGLPYDPVKDFAPITQIVSGPQLLVVRNDIPVHTVKELIAYAKANPGKLSYGSVGVGSTTHLAGELFASRAGINIVHVPYRGAPPIITDMLGGSISMAFFGLSAVIQQVQAGQLRALGISSLERSPNFPDIPAISETVPGFKVDSWHGLMAPAGTPKEIVVRLQQEVAKALKSPDVVEWMKQNGFDGYGTTPDEYAATIRSDIDTWAKIVRTANITSK